MALSQKGNKKIKMTFKVPIKMLMKAQVMPWCKLRVMEKHKLLMK